jgi:hypothetical protein
MSDKPSMTRQGYELIAGVIRDARSTRGLTLLAAPLTRQQKVVQQAWANALESLAKDFAAELSRTNSRFDRERFLRACDPAEQYTNRSRATKERNDRE